MPSSANEIDPGSGCGDTRLELFNSSSALAVTVDNNKVLFLFLAVISVAGLCNCELIIKIINTTRQGHRI